MVGFTMNNGTRYVNGIMLDEYFVANFLDALTKKVNGDNANFILQKLGNVDFNFMELLGEISSAKEIKELAEKLKKTEKRLDMKKQELRTAREARQKAVEEKKILSNDIYNYISALRYYEDTLEAMGCRRDILMKEDLGKIFDDEEDGWE
jgi:uncharacterized protein (DUF342 family)